METGSFLKDLFDFEFKTFITLKVLKVVYIISVALIGLAAVAFLISGLSQGGATAVLAIVMVPLVALLYLIMARVYVEVIAMFFRIGDHTAKIHAHLIGLPPTAEPPMGTNLE